MPNPIYGGVIEASSQITPPPQWDGKRILALGTSVGINGGDSASPYGLLEDVLGVPVENNCLSGQNLSLRATKPLVGTIAEYTAGTTNENGTDWTLTQGDTHRSYENLVLKAELGFTPDLYIIHFGENDSGYGNASHEGTEATSNKDRGTLFGAFNYLIDDVIYDDNRAARFLIVSNWKSLALVDDYLERAAALWNLPFLKLGTELGHNTVNVNSGDSEWGANGTDSVHPDTTKTTLRMAYALAEKIRSIA